MASMVLVNLFMLAESLHNLTDPPSYGSVTFFLDMDLPAALRDED